MASNKERIETNNTRLSAISTQLDDLPPKVNLDATTITPGIENQVISSGTYLSGDLTVLGDSDLVAGNIKEGVNIFGVDGTFDNSNGQYVWKKYSGASNSITLHFQLITSSVNPSVIQVSSDDIDLSTIDADFFIGFKGTHTYTYNGTSYPYEFEFKSNGVFIYGGGDFTYSYEPSSAQITVAFTMHNYSPCTITDFVKEAPYNFAVDNDPTAYPDGGVHGGYWYEKMVKGKAGVDFGEVTFASQTSSDLVVSHSLNKVPSYAFIIPKTGIGMSTDYVKVVQSLIPLYNGERGVTASYYSVSSHASSSSASVDNIIFKCGDSIYWASTTYIWVAIA